MADESNSTTDQQPERRFRVKLLQRVPEHWVVAEQFEQIGNETLGGDKKEALRKVQNFVDDEKDLDKADYKLEVEEIEDPAPEAETPPSE